MKQLPSLFAIVTLFACTQLNLFKISGTIMGIQDVQTSWMNVADDFSSGRLARGISQYGMDFLHSTVLTDPDGVIIDKLLQGDELDNKLVEVLGF